MKAVHLTGARAVGKSAVGWELFGRALRAGLPVAYLDTAQLGFHADPDHHRHNVTAVAANHHAAGARWLILTGPPTPAPPGATTCHLTATPEVLSTRRLRRSRGEGPPIPGDDLRGLTAARLAELPDTIPVDADLTVDTTGLTAVEAADAVLALLPDWFRAVSR
ncbi:hypothetical protein [Saccharothrix obliqua]|uniref:hypothetical protein n=1 Tax=Saccharothrix obliqua TaxID=2861747 RepID=UPI001C5DDE4D|nr:hypothetical protein [Saccharothrix obliqua]MBW4721421.1 hypothetical protein [Saccharothrix obliqua]